MCRVCKIWKIWGFWVTWAFWPNFGFFLGIWRWCTPPFSSVLNKMVQKNFPNLSPFGRYRGVWLLQFLVDFFCMCTEFQGFQGLPLYFQRLGCWCWFFCKTSTPSHHIVYSTLNRCQKYRIISSFGKNIGFKV